MKDRDSETPMREKEVPKQMQLLKSNVENLGEAVEVLELTLNDVIKPASVLEDDAPSREGLVPLAEGIKIQNENICKLADRIRDITGRLEI